MTRCSEQLSPEGPLPVDSLCEMQELVWCKQNVIFVVLNLDSKVQNYDYFASQVLNG